MRPSENMLKETNLISVCSDRAGASLHRILQTRAPLARLHVCTGVYAASRAIDSEIGPTKSK